MNETAETNFAFKRSLPDVRATGMPTLGSCNRTARRKVSQPRRQEAPNVRFRRHFGGSAIMGSEVLDAVAIERAGAGAAGPGTRGKHGRA